MANKPINEKTRPRAYTLHQVQTEVGRRFDAEGPTDSGGRRLSPPAMPTLKLWSKVGVFNLALTLTKAADIAAARVIAQPERFRTVNLRSGESEPKAPLVYTRRHGAAVTQSSNDETKAELQAVRSDLAVMQARFNELQRISDMAYSSIQKLILLVQAQAQSSAIGVGSVGASNNQATSPGDVMPESMVRAIDQLDAVRKHVMLGMNREVQLLRQQSGAVQNRPQEGVSLLDVQRIIARLSNVEQRSIEIVQILQSQVKQ